MFNLPDRRFLLINILQSKKLCLLTVYASAFLLFAEVSVADESANSSATNPDSEQLQSQDIANQSDVESLPEENDTFFSMIDKPQQYISSGINGFSRGIDEFFSDEKVEYEINESYLRLTGDMIISEGGNTGFESGVKGKIELPNTKRKLKLVFESDHNEERENPGQKQEDNSVATAQDKSFFGGIEGLKEFKYWKIRPGIGLKLGSERDIFARIIANRLYKISEKWQAYLRNSLYKYSSRGYVFNTLLELDRKIDDRLLFRSATSGQWEEENEFWELNQLFSLTQSVSKKEALIYLVAVFGESEPRVFATDYLLQLRYRKLLHSDYLFLELSPKIVYERENDFEPNFSFTIRAEIVFKG